MIANADINSFETTFSKNELSLGTTFVEEYILRPVNTKFRRKMEDGFCTDPLQNCKVEDCWECNSWRISYDEYMMKKHVLEEKMKIRRTSLDEVIENLKELYKTIYSNIGYDEYYSVDNPELRKSLISKSKRIEEAVSNYINLAKVSERIDRNEKR